LLENAIADAEQDAVASEHMPDARPEEEEQETDEEANGGQEDEVQPDSNGAQEIDNECRMPGQLPMAAEQTSAKDYHSIKNAAKEKVAALLGHELTMSTKSNDNMKWKVVESYEPPKENILPLYEKRGACSCVLTAHVHTLVGKGYEDECGSCS
jgi:hypothetical protein